MQYQILMSLGQKDNDSLLVFENNLSCYRHRIYLPASFLDAVKNTW